MKEVYRGNFRCSRVFFPTSSALPLPKCFQTEQSTAEASLIVFDKECINFLTHSA